MYIFLGQQSVTNFNIQLKNTLMEKMWNYHHLGTNVTES